MYSVKIGCGGRGAGDVEYSSALVMAPRVKCGSLAGKKARKRVWYVSVWCKKTTGMMKIRAIDRSMAAVV